MQFAAYFTNAAYFEPASAPVEWPSIGTSLLYT